MMVLADDIDKGQLNDKPGILLTNACAGSATEWDVTGKQEN